MQYDVRFVDPQIVAIRALVLCIADCLVDRWDMCLCNWAISPPGLAIVVEACRGTADIPSAQKFPSHLSDDIVSR